jgi:hypothetical protein
MLALTILYLKLLKSIIKDAYKDLNNNNINIQENININEEENNLEEETIIINNKFINSNLLYI